MSNYPWATALVGKKFGRLTALQRSGRDKHNRALYLCTCECGNQRIASAFNLRQGYTKSCGCLRRDYERELTKHGLSKTAEYNVWKNILQRCDPKWKQSRDYFDRGITVCGEWANRDTGFQNFLAHIGERPSPKHSLDRIDNSKGYRPENVRWATRDIQVANRRIKRIENFTDSEIRSEYERRFGCE